MNDFDPDAFLKGSPATAETAIKGEKPVSDFNPDAFLAPKEEVQQKYNPPSAIESAVQTAMPAMYTTGPGMNMPSVSGAVQTAKTIAQPAASALGGVAKTYITNPVAALTDLTMGHFGLPPPVAGTQIAPGVKESYQQVKDWLSKSGQFAPKAAVAGDELANAARISEALGPEGLAAAMKPGATIPTEVPPVGRVAGVMGKVAPVLRTAGRVLGPAGLALNAYDASQYAEAAKLGERLANGQGQMAQQAFRHNAVNMPTPQQLQPTEAANLLASGDQRTINIYGGVQHLQAIAGGKSPSAPPTSDNFIERMRAMANQYGTIK